MLGIGKNVPSKVFGVTSGLALGIGLYCVAQSNLLNILSGSTVPATPPALPRCCRVCTRRALALPSTVPATPAPLGCSAHEPPRLRAQVNGFYVAGALLVPYSWGLHVASWIQKQNGK